MRVVALDFGSRRIGIAFANTEFKVAVPSQVFMRSTDANSDMRRLAHSVEEYEPQAVVIGLPLTLAGKSSKQTKRVIVEARSFAKHFQGAIYLWDERFSSKRAENALRDGGLDSRHIRGRVDSAAASFILQTWLEADDSTRSMHDLRNFTGEG